MLKKFASIALLPLVTLLGGCPGTTERLTPTIETGSQPKVCSHKAWQSGPHVSFASKHDTPETVSSAREVNKWMDGNNARHDAYCAAQ